MTIIIQAVLTGMLVMLAGTLPRNLLFAANLRFYPDLPWAVPLTAAYLWFGWRYLKRAEPWRAGLRANPVSGRVWAWALLAGGLAIVALVFGLQVANRMVVLPVQQMPDLGKVPGITIVSLLIMAAPVAGIVEEAAFRGYMQGPIERRFGLGVAILVTGTMFAALVAAARDRLDLLAKHGLSTGLVDEADKLVAQYRTATETASAARQEWVHSSAELELVGSRIMGLVDRIHGLNRHRFATQPDLLATWEVARNLKTVSPKPSAPSNDSAAA